MSNLPDDFVFSQSNLQDYAACARRFDLRYRQHQRWPAPEVDDLLAFEQRMEQGARFHHLVNQHLSGIPESLLLPRITDPDVRAWFETYLQAGLTDVPPERYAERTLTVPVGDYRLLAKFDLVATGDDRALIVDWKTSRRIPHRQDLAQQWQTIVYRYVLAAGGARFNDGKPIAPEQIEMRYWYAAHNGTTHSFRYDSEQFKADEAILLTTMREIDNRADFPLTDDVRRCRFCTYRSLCDRGTSAGPLAEWDLLDDIDTDLDSFNLDLDQIAEIEF